MSTLWQPKSKYDPFDLGINYTSDFYGILNQFLPYERTYDCLNQHELRELLQDARLYHWQALDLSCCGLATLPDELWELQDLRILYLGNLNCNKNNRNTFSFLPRKIERLTNLQVLNFRDNSFQIEGDTPLRLNNLRHLELFDCGFTQFPSALLIPSLEVVRFNCLGKYLSESFVSLKNLRRLYLVHSRLTELPESIGSLTYLQTLSLAQSDIQSIPASLLQLKELKTLFLHGTPLKEMVPAEILLQSTKEIIRYILAQQSDAPKQYFNESKMIIVGQGQVGKSSLLKRLLHNTYSDTSSTEGIDIARWNFSKNDEDYQLNVWDFGGQEIYHSTHQFFLTKRSLYLLVWDALAEDEAGRLDYWLKTIQSFANDSPILIIVNKCDKDIGRFRRIDEKDYLERYPQIQKIYYVSCKDNIGISELREDIKQLSVGLPLMKTSWLTSWMNVRKELETLSEQHNFITYREYLGICKNKQIDKEEALSLIKYLHDLGLVLCYHDDPLLKEMVILSAEWGTDAVYRVLDEQEHKLKGRNGILYYLDLPEIWADSDRYPQERFPYLLNLMKKFQLSFGIDDSTYLIAELLDNNAITLEKNFSNEETLSFRYDYDFIPAGVMTRFIVAINHFLETRNGIKQCWKKGAYLQHRTAYALVRLYDNFSERYVQIQISGTNPRDKQELLTVIRTAFEKINGMFHHIKITERIPCICSAQCDFLFDYETLLFAERKGKDTIQCLRSLENVDVRKMLDGVEKPMTDNSKESGYVIHNHIEFKPEITTSPTSVATSTSETVVSNSVQITQEIHATINGLLGDWNDLKDEIIDESEEFAKECRKIDKAISKLDNSKTNEDVVKSGAMKKLERFLKECHDPNSDTGKLLAGIKHSSEMVKDLAGKYNKIAKWLALPQLPFGNK